MRAMMVKPGCEPHGLKLFPSAPKKGTFKKPENQEAVGLEESKYVFRSCWAGHNPCLKLAKGKNWFASNMKPNVLEGP